MRILLASNYFPPHIGGIQYAAGSLKRCWEADGYTVTWVAADVPRGGERQPNTVRIPAWNVLENLVQINAPIPSPFVYGRISRLVAEHDVVNVHSLSPGVTALVLRAAMRQNKPLVVTQHVGIIPLNIPGLTALQNLMIRRAARRIADYGAVMTFVGKAVRDWFVDQAGFPAELTRMTPAGVDHDRYHFVDDAERAAYRRKWNLGDERFHVLFVGRFCDKKELPLIRAVADANRNIHYTLVGTGPIRADRWGLPNVTVHSYVDDNELRELYGAHDLFIMPSYGEGWPAVVPQAMCCGLACLVSEETFAGHDRDPDRFIVTPRSTEIVRERILRAAHGDDPLIRERRALSEYATATWNWMETARIYIKLFEEAVEKKR